MSISLKTHKRLWARGGNECAFPGCPHPLLVPLEEDEADGDTLVGKECHIVSKADDGPRGPKRLSADERDRWRHLIDDRDGYANLLLLCGVHHDVIDGDEGHYTVDRVVAMKGAHERTVAARTTPAENQRNAIEIRYASIVDTWARRIELDRWDARISRLATAGAIEADYLEALTKTGFWLLNRVWPRTLPELEDAFLNFRRVGEDLEAVVSYYSTERGGEVLVDRVYKEAFYEQAQYDFLAARSEYFRDLAADLAIELTRAVNLISDRVRQHLWPDYRLREGYATIGLGLDASLTFQTLRPLYPPQVSGVPYSGLARFVRDRMDRDYARGSEPPPANVTLPGARLEE